MAFSTCWSEVRICYQWAGGMGYKGIHTEQESVDEDVRVRGSVGKHLNYVF